MNALPHLQGAPQHTIGPSRAAIKWRSAVSRRRGGKRVNKAWTSGVTLCHWRRRIGGGGWRNWHQRHRALKSLHPAVARWRLRAAGKNMALRITRVARRIRRARAAAA